MAYMDKVKRDMRRSSPTFDEDIADLITEARTDLVLRGIPAAKAEDESDPVIFRYVSYYCQQHFGIQSPEDYQKITKALETQRVFLMLSGKYGGAQ